MLTKDNERIKYIFQSHFQRFFSSKGCANGRNIAKEFFDQFVPSKIPKHELSFLSQSLDKHELFQALQDMAKGKLPSLGLDGFP